jgi:hypothetical protein
MALGTTTLALAKVERVVVHARPETVACGRLDGSKPTFHVPSSTPEEGTPCTIKLGSHRVTTKIAHPCDTRRRCCAGWVKHEARLSQVVPDVPGTERHVR